MKNPVEAEAFCAPHRTNNYKKFNTCLTRDELATAAQDWNTMNPSIPIKDIDKLSIAKLKRALADRHKTSTGCIDELCWVKESPSLSNKSRDIFRPLRSNKWRTGRTWLNTLDIQHVMKQYELVHKDFMFLGVFPIDFEREVQGACVSMCNFKITDLIAAKKRRFSMVINLDTHDQPGSHWVTLFCNIDPKDPKYGACYFDSGGVRPEPILGTKDNPIEQFLKRIKDEVVELYGDSHKTHFWVRYSPERKQYKNTECGMFCLLFNILCLEKPMTYKEIRRLIGNDDDVHELRKILFANADIAKRKAYTKP